MVFPAHAGMNRRASMVGICGVGVPRTRGDEPKSLLSSTLIYLCSPHTRG